MSLFFESQLCQSQTRCHECRLSKTYRKGILEVFEKPVLIDFDCPFGRTAKEFKGLPSPLEMLKGATKAVERVAKATLDGEDQLVIKKEAEARMAICESCEHRTIKGDNLMCRVCGCFLGFKTKLATESCPKGKWCSTVSC